VDLHAIGADVHPVGIEILRHDAAPGADITAAVLLVPEGGREQVQVHLAVAPHVLEHGTALDVHGIEIGRVRLPRLGLAAQLVHQAVVRFLDADTQDGGELARAAGAARQDAESLWKTLDLVEQQRGWRLFLNVQLADGAQLEVPIRPADVRHLAELPGFLEPGAEIKRISFFRPSHPRLSAFVCGCSAFVSHARR
jgi:hypothetical protein